jgi:hypothetical protein
MGAFRNKFGLHALQSCMISCLHYKALRRKIQYYKSSISQTLVQEFVRKGQGYSCTQLSTTP